MSDKISKEDENEEVFLPVESSPSQPGPSPAAASVPLDPMWSVKEKKSFNTHNMVVDLSIDRQRRVPVDVRDRL